MPAKKSSGSPWDTIFLQPLSGGLDVRSRPADIPQGWLRWKSNMSVTALGKPCRRSGFSKAFSRTGYTNFDLHQQGAVREPITFLHEQTWGDASRQLFAGTESRLYLLNEAAGTWATILSGKGAATSVWRGAALADQLLFVNGIDDVQFWAKAGGMTDSCPDLISLGTTAPRVIAEFNGFILLMNVIEQGTRQLSRIRWCDLNAPTVWLQPAVIDDTHPANASGFQDLDYGDEILAAAPLLGALYIFTRRAIWRCNISAAATQTFSFTRVYYEPENQAGCIVYPYTLVSDGTDFWFMSRDAIYKFNPYMVAPDRKDSDGNDWLYRASGAIYTKADTQINAGLCNLPCARFVPLTREIYISWPSGTNQVNNWTLVGQIDQRTADIVDHGFTAMRNYREAPENALFCNEQQSFLCASGVDWCIKDLSAGVFYREMAVTDPGGVTVDLPATASYVTLGYNTVFRGQVPSGYYDREKAIRKVLLDHDTTFQDKPCVVTLRIGNSFHQADPNDADDECAVLWQALSSKPMACPDLNKISVMKAKNLRPAVATQWNFLYEGIYIYFELTIANDAKGTPAIGGDTCWESLQFDLMAKPKA